VINHTVSEGLISCGVHTDTIVKENLVSVSRGVVYHSRSDAQRINNRSMPTNIVTKSCLYAPGHYTPQQFAQTSTEDNVKADNNTNSIFFGLVPEEGTMPFIGGVEMSVRSEVGFRDWIAPQGANIVVGFGPKAFSYVIVPACSHVLGPVPVMGPPKSGWTWTSLSEDIRLGTDPSPGPSNCGGLWIPVMFACRNSR
jgi:hypothetical protein